MYSLPFIIVEVVFKSIIFWIVEIEQLMLLGLGGECMELFYESMLEVGGKEIIGIDYDGLCS